jgi:hypothetical protein
VTEQHCGLARMRGALVDIVVILLGHGIRAQLGLGRGGFVEAPCRRQLKP